MDVPTKSKSVEEPLHDDAKIVTNPMGVNSLPKKVKNKKKQKSGVHIKEGKGTFNFFDEHFKLYMQSITENEFHFIYRVRKAQFYEIHEYIKNGLNLNNAKIPESITTEERLLIALKYLGAGVGAASLGSSYQISEETVKEILLDVCNAISTKMGPIYMPKPTVDTWRNSENMFKYFLDFPNCCGAIFARRLVLRNPITLEKLNYEDNGIVVLMILNARGKVLYAEFVSSVENSPGGVFFDSALKTLIEEGEIQLPAPKPFCRPNLEPTNHVFIANEEFPLKPFMLTPYNMYEARLSEANITFNSRLTVTLNRAKVAFASINTRWCFFQSAVQILPGIVEKLYLAIFCLNNYLGFDDLPPFWNSRIGGPMRNFTYLTRIFEPSTEDALVVRRKFNSFFYNQAPFPWRVNTTRMFNKG